jgi:hypothetical protein
LLTKAIRLSSGDYAQSRKLDPTEKGIVEGD